jgi:hypothetical protein
MGGGYVMLRSSLHGAVEDRAVEMRASDYLRAKSVLRRDTMHASDKKKMGFNGHYIGSHPHHIIPSHHTTWQNAKRRAGKEVKSSPERHVLRLLRNITPHLNTE